MQSRFVTLRESHNEFPRAKGVPFIEADNPLTSILLIGASFKTSSIEFREKLNDALSSHVARNRSWEGVKESATLQTCNRIELYFVSDEAERTEADFFSCLPPNLRAKRDSFYILTGMSAMQHLFELASGLDSMVVGEDQILSQLKDMARSARLAGRSRAVLSTLFDVATSAGARVRATQDFPAENRSVSAFALNFALSRLGRKPKRVLLVGTGKVMKLAAEELESSEVYVATRRKETSLHFSSAKVVHHSEIRKVARKCDLIISATKREAYVIRRGDIPDDTHRVLLDLAFPRNIDPRLRDSRNIELYDLDDLAANADTLASQTTAFTRQARRMIEEEASKFGRWLTASRFSPALASLYRWAEGVRNSEADMALRRLANLSPRDKRIIAVMSKRLVSRLLAPATVFAKESTEDLSQQQRLRILSEIFAKGKGKT